MKKDSTAAEASLKVPTDRELGDRSGHVESIRDIFKLIRPHQWIKNALVAVPLFTSLKWGDTAAWSRVMVTAAALSLCASATYVINDILDVKADRRHPQKRFRPIAAGRISKTAAVFVMVTALIGGMVCGSLVLTSAGFLCLVAYSVLSTTYSLFFKHRLLVDVFVLTGLYVIRIVIGGEASLTPVTLWLLALAWFFFLGLAFAKRFTELRLAGDQGTGGARAYRSSDLAPIRAAGIASGFMACLVFCLYVASATTVTQGYSHPYVLWLIAPLLLYWTTRVWLLAERDAIDHDPVWFAIKDRVSWAVLGLMIVLSLVSTLDWI